MPESVPRPVWILITAAVTIFLLEKAWQIAMHFSQTILLFTLAALLAFILNPLVSGLSANPVPAPVRRMARRTWGDNVGQVLDELHLHRGVASVLVYLGLILLLIATVLFLVPVVVTQLIQLAASLPGYTGQIPSWLSFWQERLRSFGLQIDLPAVITSGGVLQRVQGVATNVVQNALSMAGGLASFLSNTLMVLFLSFYMMLDGSRLLHQCIALIPDDWQDEAQFFLREVDRTFGGFVRGQLIQSGVFAVGTAIVLVVARLKFALLVSLVAALLMLIPLVGVVLSLLPPLIITLFLSPADAWWIFLSLLLFQQVLINVVMPRVMSEVVGMHPLLIFGALLVGLRVAGLWGAFFGIPVAGVIYSVLAFFVNRLRKTGRLNGDVLPKQ